MPQLQVTAVISIQESATRTSRHSTEHAAPGTLAENEFVPAEACHALSHPVRPHNRKQH
jgi:hypothetical protein